MKKLSIFVAGSIASIFMLGSTLEAQAQQQQQQQQQAPDQQQMPATPEGSSIDVDQEELERFADAFRVVQRIQEESRQEMAEAIEQEGLTIEEYNQMFRQQQQPEAEESEMSSEKQEQFQQADNRISEIEEEAQNEIESAITDKGMEMQRFEEIWVSIQQDPELQQEVQEILQN
ncbi:MAG: DUF4168 domain-containing protein [Halothece sp.]